MPDKCPGGCTRLELTDIIDWRIETIELIFIDCIELPTPGVSWARFLICFAHIHTHMFLKVS